MTESIAARRQQLGIRSDGFPQRRQPISDVKQLIGDTAALSQQRRPDKAQSSYSTLKEHALALSERPVTPVISAVDEGRIYREGRAVVREKDHDCIVHHTLFYEGCGHAFEAFIENLISKDFALFQFKTLSEILFLLRLRYLVKESFFCKEFSD